VLDRGASRHRPARRERREESRCWRNVTYGTDVSATNDSDLSRGILSNVISPALRITRIIVLQISCISCSRWPTVSDVRALRDTLKGREKKMREERRFLKFANWRILQKKIYRIMWTINVIILHINFVYGTDNIRLIRNDLIRKICTAARFSEPN